jgi:hypothetical protein
VFFLLIAMASEDVVLDLGVVKKLVRPGHGKRPGEGDEVTITYIGRLPNGHVFDESKRGENLTVSFRLDSPGVVPGEFLRLSEVRVASVDVPDLQCPLGLLVGVRSMAVGEVSTFDVPPAAAYGDEGHSLSGVPPRTRVIFDVTLVSAAVAASNDPSADLPASYNPLIDAESLKGHGNARLKSTDFAGALFKYQNV